MIETVGDLRKALEVFDPSSRIMTNFGMAGTYIPDNSPILDVKKSGATGIIYIQVPYKLVCSKCGKFIDDEVDHCVFSGSQGECKNYIV